MKTVDHNAAQRVPLTKQVRDEVKLVGEKLSSGSINEGEAARKLLMLVGPTIEMAVAVAAGVSSYCDGNANKTIDRIRSARSARSVQELGKKTAASKGVARRSCNSERSAKPLSCASSSQS
eukprot:CAMPEP_0119313420 /NCGR_PEP_ID=MMETSP1333-20130426/29074_1 /TAXON_ID=418940 /ORGANISM="Scyphosphaera apsteinii, Strain RCC1455" /LENGTH=120 /DNA_ID=CAMNT_0007318259 /DNA_START=293 /DNA_END=655 /DNA_ORIENTATION=-